MSGKEELKDLPPGSKRACRAVLTQDFDDLQGDVKTMYRAVIFNPVPGPPMGPNTRLSFKYKLHGTSTLRVQLYSLTNGYHRYLSVSDLPQDKWEEGTVDMTQMRRPDGSGGPLSADERIDDIQFYIDPRAISSSTTWYSATPPLKTKNALSPSTSSSPAGSTPASKARNGQARSRSPCMTSRGHGNMPNQSRAKRRSKTEAEVRLRLRGERPLGKECELKFLYHLEGKGPVDVVLYRAGKPLPRAMQRISKLQTGAWTETTLKYTVGSARRNWLWMKSALGFGEGVR